MLHAFFYGFILAFGLIIPLGSQNLFVFNQGATQRHFLHALPCVLSASLCDAFLIILAVLGISVIVLNMLWLKTLIFSIGFFFLVYMGWVTWKSKPARLKSNVKPLSARLQVAFTVSISLLNPHAIMDTVVVIGTNSLQFSGNMKYIYTFACIFVSCLWFFGLSVAGHFVHKIDKKGNWLIILNKISAFIMWGVALYIARLLVYIYIRPN